MGMRIRPGETEANATYVSGRFAGDDAFVVNSIDGQSPLGGILACLGSDYFVEVAPDGSGRSWFDGRPITAPNGTGKAWYIRDQESGDTWSAFYGPTCTRTREYEVSFSPGSVTSYSLHNKVACSITIAPSPDYPCELWRVKLQNRSATDRTIIFTSYVRPRAGSALECKYIGKEKALVMRRPLDALDSERTGRAVQDLMFFKSCTLAPTRYEIEKSHFIGEGRSLQNPEFIELTRQNEVEPIAESGVAAFSFEIDLPIEGEAEFGFCFGAARNIEDALMAVRANATLADIDKAMAVSRARWTELCSTLRVQTEDRAFNALTNTWLAYEACAEWIKDHAGAPHLDPYRAADALRCLTPFYATAPELCRETLLNFAARISVLGAYTADDQSQVTLPPKELLWLAVCTARYVAETGDISVLERSVSLKDGPSLTLAEHCERAIRMCLYDRDALAQSADMALLEQGLKLWSLVAEDSDEFGSRLAELKNQRVATRPEYPEERSRPRRLQYLECICPSIDCEKAAEMLGDTTEDSGMAWLVYSVISQTILGLEATSGGLIIDPRLPEHWSECAITRKFRGDTYNIHIKRAPGPARKASSIIVDGEPVLGNTLPFFGDGKEHGVDVTVG